MEDGECGIPIPVKERVMGSHHVWRGMCDIEKAAEACLRYAQDENLLKEHAKVGLKKVKEIYDYDLVAKSFDKVLRKLSNGGYSR